MRKITLFILMVILVNPLFSQQGFNYKAIIADGGIALPNKAVTVYFTILDGATSIYEENHDTTTDTNGIIIVNIGEGTTTLGLFKGIDWSSEYLLNVQVDAGSGLKDMGTNPFKAVPYAKYALIAKNAFSGDFNDLSNVPASIDDDDFYKVGTTSPSNDINDDIYHLGNITIGKAGSPSGTLAIEAQNGTAIINSFNSTYSGSLKGVYNALTQTGNYSAVGVTNTIVGDFSNVAIGMSNNISSNGSDNYGVNNYFGGNGEGLQYGLYNHFDTAGDGTIFGVRNLISSISNGDKYGTYNTIDSNTGTGTHYAFYGRALKTGSFAGYFVGDVRVTQKLTAPHSGDESDMKAYIYGKVYGAGTVPSTGNTNGFTANKQSTGVYRIYFTNSPDSIYAYIAVASMYNGIGFIETSNSATYFTVKTYNTSGVLEDNDFTFVVYKQ